MREEDAAMRYACGAAKKTQCAPRSSRAVRADVQPQRRRQRDCAVRAIRPPTPAICRF